MLYALRSLLSPVEATEATQSQPEAPARRLPTQKARSRRSWGKHTYARREPAGGVPSSRPIRRYNPIVRIILGAPTVRWSKARIERETRRRRRSGRGYRRSRAAIMGQVRFEAPIGAFCNIALSAFGTAARTSTPDRIQRSAALVRSLGPARLAASAHNELKRMLIRPCPTGLPHQEFPDAETRTAVGTVSAELLTASIRT